MSESVCRPAIPEPGRAIRLAKVHTILLGDVGMYGGIPRFDSCRDLLAKGWIGQPNARASEPTPAEPCAIHPWTLAQDPIERRQVWTAAFIVVPLEEGQVTIYDGNLNTIDTHTFTETDVQDMDYWYYDLGIGRYSLIAESTGDIAFMVGQTMGTTEIDYLGDDIAFIGSRPNQEIRFYAPTMAVIFAPETLTINIDGGAPIQMAEDDFRLLDSGVHSLSADKHVVVEVLAAGAGWNNWGSYLIEPSDVDVSFEAPEDFTAKAVDYTIYIAGGVVAVAVVVVLFMLRRRRVG